MAYRELIKNFERIRSYMRQFYVYGFKSREEYDDKSARSYDNERRRLESWLGEYMSFRHTPDGKNVFISVDSREITRNPFYKAFAAKSFTDKDITLHFYIMDALSRGAKLTLRELLDRIDGYIAATSAALTVDESTLRKKLREYSELGLVSVDKSGKETIYSTAADSVDTDEWREAIAFFMEDSPLGVVGSYMSDADDSSFRFKHHYLLHALDSEYICTIFDAMSSKRRLTITQHSARSGAERTNTVYPMKLYISTQSGRQYLLAYSEKFRRPMFFRVDSMVNIELGEVEHNAAKYDSCYDKFASNLWGVSTSVECSLDHIEMTIHVDDDEKYIVDRLNREKRAGVVEVLDEHTCKFTADVYDAGEMLPWIRTFVGRIVSIDCSNREVTRQLHEDMEWLRGTYGGDGDAV